MKENFNIAFQILKEFHKNGILNEIILIGSWCLFFYRDMFGNTSEIHEVKTLDIDFLVPDNKKIKGDYNIPEILKRLKFMEYLSPDTGKVKYVSPELEVEFLIAEQGKGYGGKAVVVEKLGVRAIGLRYLNLLSGHTMRVKFEGMTITIPEPAAFALHKFIISERRFKSEKREKDLITAIQLGNFIVKDAKQKYRMIEIFKDLPQKWRKTILKIVEEQCMSVYVELKD